MPTLAPPDRQVKWAPRWVLESLALPERYYGTKDLAFRVDVTGDPFIVGDSDVGGDDLVGGGAGGGDRPAHGNIMGDVVVTRSLVDVLGGQIEVQQFAIDLANKDGRLRGDYRNDAVKLWRYDEASRLTVLAVTGIIAQGLRGRGTYRLLGTTLDRAILEALIPKGLITLAEFPLAAPDAVGTSAPWVFGNVPNLPLPNVRDDQIKSQFDYLLCRDSAAALTGLRRLMPGGVNPFITMTYDELEPYPGADGALLNGSFEGWDAGATSNPDDWTTNAGATIAKNITPAQVSEGSASAALTRAGADCRLSQDLAVTALPFVPLSWWWLREITVVVDVHATVAARGLIRVSDGVTDFDSPFHTGGGTIEALTVGTELAPCIINAAATRVRVECRIHTGNTTVTFDNVRVYIRAKSWAEVLRPDLYPGYTAIRSFLRQEDASGSLYQIVADVKGKQPERNPVRAILTLLSDPTHGLGKAVDAASFDAAETAICLTYEDAINLDGPELFAPFRDALGTVSDQTCTVRDRSGHERHGTYDKGTASFLDILAGSGASGDANDAYMDNSDPQGQSITFPGWTSGLAVSLGITLNLPFTLPDATARPIAEKLIGTGLLSGHAIYRESNVLKFVVRGADLNLYTVTSPLVDATDENRWIDIVGVAADGVLLLYRDGLLAATGSYTGALLTGYGDLLVAKFGVGLATTGPDRYDNIRAFNFALPAARVAAQRAAMLALQSEAVSDYDREIMAKGPTFVYRCTEALGDTVMTDDSGNGHTGVWTGGPTLGVPGPLNPERGIVNSYTQVRFTNNVAKYGVETGMTLNDAAATITGFYRAPNLTAPSGLVEKTIGGVRSTQWGLCQRGPVARLTLVHAGGILSLDVPLLTEDVGRETWLLATWSAGAVQVYKNGALAVEGIYTAPVASGVGDFYLGVQGTNGAGLTRPCQGDLGRWSYIPSQFTAADVARIWTAATWYNGGLCVDAALREPRQVQDVIADICQMRGIRLGFTDGTITVAVDAAAPTTIRLDARDGAGAGERTLIDAGPRTQTPLQNAVGALALSYRPDLLSGAFLGQFTQVIRPHVGKTLPVKLAMVREHPSAWRVLDYLWKRMFYGDETVPAVLTQEARQLTAGDLVRLTDLALDYDAAVLEARKVEQLLEHTKALLAGWDASIYVPDAIAFPSGAMSG